MPLERKWCKLPKAFLLTIMFWHSSFLGRQTSHNLFCHCIGPRRDLLRRLVLNWMLYINGIKARTAQCARLNARRSGEFRGGHRNRGNAQVF